MINVFVCNDFIFEFNAFLIQNEGVTNIVFHSQSANSEEQLAILFVLKQVVSIIAYMYGIK